MFKYLFKLLLLTTLFCSSFLHADGTDIPISVSNKIVNETSGTVTFTITLAQAPISIFGMTVKYQTRNGSATAVDDYEEKTGGLLDFFYFPYGVSSRDLTLDIYDDAIYEGNENFYVDVTTSASGYQPSATGQASIVDDEIQPLILNIFNDKGITESDINQTLSMVAYFNQTLSSPLTLTYHTVDGTALAGSDYVAVPSSTTINIPSGVNRVILPITIKGDVAPETTKSFQVVIDSISSGTISDNSATALIYDNDTIQVSVDCNNTAEGNVGDNNQMPCRIYLSKSYPVGQAPLSIDYASQDGTANVNVDYTESNGTVTFNTGDLEHVVYIPIIGDDVIEPDESVSMIISGSTSIVNNTATALILNDDGSYPTLLCSSTSVSIVEGDSGQSVLTYNFTLDTPAIANTSFDYETSDDDEDDKDDDDGDGDPHDEDEDDDDDGDGDDDDDHDGDDDDDDYVKVPKSTYVTNVGDTNISISMFINGDSKIENDELFSLVLSNANNIHLGTCTTTTTTIINDDGDFPKITISDANITEGDSGISNMDFIVSLDKAPVTPITLDYQIFNGNDANGALNAFSPVDYINNNVITPIVLDANNSTYTISVPINGDTTIEQDEKFYIQLTNSINATFAKDIGTGTIISDDTDDRFTCNADASAYVFGSTAYNNPTDAYGFNLSDGTKVSSNLNIHPSNINAIGYNVTDNYIWGYDRENYQVVSVNKDYQVTSYNIAGLPDFAPADDVNPTYHVGDVSLNGVFYLATRSDSKKIYRVDVNPSSNTYLEALSELKLSTGIDVADFAFSPVDEKLYAVDITNNLLRIDPKDGQVTNLGAVNVKNGGNTIVSIFFDKTGRLYAHQSGTGDVYQINPPSNYQPKISANVFSNIGATVHGDGARCPYATVTQTSKNPFVCDSTMYISSSIKRGTGTTGNMWLHRIDTSQNPFGFSLVDDAGVPELYNALAYSEVDNYIYALYFRDLLQISSVGQVTNLGKVTQLPALLDTRQLYAGAAYGGEYYVSGPGSDYDKIFKINIADHNVTEINLTQAVSIKDFSFSPDGSTLYGIIDGGSMVKINVADGNVTNVGSPHLGYEFDSTFSDASGRFFANDSNGNGFFEFNVATGTKSFLSNSQPATFNDGANCLNATLTFNDYGDAPLSYGPVWHRISNGIQLGANIDHDIKSFDSINADGDDLNGIDDDDGVTLVDGSDLNGTYFELNVTHELNVTLAKDAYLRIWIDKGIDGDFNDIGDLVYDSVSLLSAGTHTVSFFLPAGLKTNQTTYLRARVSSVSNLMPTGFTTDGEVEDYAIKFGTGGLFGKFNIERTDSATQVRMSDERNAWYTQLVGRDFDYSLVFYEEDFSAEQNISNVTVTVDLMDMDTNTSLYQYAFHIPETISPTRMDITQPLNDLASLPATKNARFRVSYGVNPDGSLVQANCLTNPAFCSNSRGDDAFDNFAIRPERFLMSISDGDKERINSNYPTPKIALASGYDYNLTFTATQHPNLVPALGYDKVFTTNFDFNLSGLSNCANTSPIQETASFTDGVHNNALFSHDDVGHYSFNIQDDATWTSVDQNNRDCIANQSFTSVDASAVKAFNIPSGCNISLDTKPIEVQYFPNHFQVSLNLQNLPSSGHDDFIYMSELSNAYNNVALAIQGDIIAQSENNQTTRNFTQGCVSTDVQLNLSASTISVEGLNAPSIQTSQGTNVNFTRLVKYNGDTNQSSTTINSALTSIANTLTITRDKFLDFNEGTLQLDMRYNVNKNLSEPINPIEVSFNAVNVNAPQATSIAHDKLSIVSLPHVPSGQRVFLSNPRNFYYAKVVSDLDNYPTVYMKSSTIIRTPLNVDIFCLTSIANYCRDRNVLDNTDLSTTTREQSGWYLSTRHNKDLDGNVTRLIPSPANVTISPNPNNDIPLENGENGLVLAEFNTCPVPLVVVSIETDPVLTFNPSQYILNCSNKNLFEWTGIGKTGNVLDIKTKMNKNKKMDW